MFDYNCTEWLVKNKADNAPIRLGQIAMIMILKKLRQKMD